MSDRSPWLDYNDAPIPRLDVVALRRGILDRLEELLAYLFPLGHVRNGKFYIGDVDGNPGESLVVELEGEKRGLWIDFATGESGDAIELWACAHRQSSKADFPDVAHALGEWLGHPAAAPNSTKASVRQAPLHDLGPCTGKWDYRNAAGELIACVYRYDPPGRGKEFRPYDVKRKLSKAPEIRPLYDQRGMLDATEVVLVEGEKCAQALIDSGICATTAMNGANALIDRTDWAPLVGKTVVVWPDNDLPGTQYADAVIPRLYAIGVREVRRVQIPDHKPVKWDAANALAEGRDVRALIATASVVPSPAAAPSTQANGLQISEWQACTRFQGCPAQRQWLVEGVFPRAQATLVAAAGGVGKSFLLLQLARDIAAFDGFSVTAPIRFGGAVAAAGAAVYITAEDDAIEVHNRLRALGEIPEGLYVVPLPDAGGTQALFAPEPFTNRPAATAVWFDLVEQISRLPNLRVIILDPLQPLCALDLNVPENAQFVCSQIAAVAAGTGASVIVSHHFAKREASTPEQAREAIRGTGGLVDGMRAVYALWPVKDDEARRICEGLDVPYQRGAVIRGGVVKANGRANLAVTTFVRDEHGLLIDRTHELRQRLPVSIEVLPDLKLAIARAAVAGQPYTKTGINGVYERRSSLPEAFHQMGKHALPGLVDELLSRGELVQALAEGSTSVKWLDVPDGPVATGHGEFVPGHLSLTIGGRNKATRSARSKEGRDHEP